MYLCRWQGRDGPRLGARLNEDTVVDLQAACTLQTGAPSAALESSIALMESGTQGLDVAQSSVEFARAAGPEGALHSFGSVRLLAPVPRPVRLFNFSVYEGHIRNGINAAVELKAGRLLAQVNRSLGVIGIPKGWCRQPAYCKGNHTSR